MKELSIEQKAQRYDEILARAEGANLPYYKEDIMSKVKEFVDYLIPELKESEDEKIRKAILSGLKYLETEIGWDAIGDIDILDAYAWLEKQSQTFTKKDVDDAYLKGVTNTKNEIEKQYEANYQIRKDIATFIFNYRGDIKDRAKWMDYLGIKVSFVEKQGEQKPADNIEPKFHEGEWIVGANNVFKIISLNDELNCYIAVTPSNEEVKIPYQFDNGQGHMCSYHLWTIQDAKDGDILTCESGWTCIFKALNDNNISFSSYCFMDKNGWFCETGSESHTLEKAFIKAYNGDIYPATKEQCDLLFQKMREAGYEWDTEKKELKKIEQKPVEWSEEDERHLNSIIKRTIAYGDSSVYGLIKDDIDWLKSIKERIQPKVEWSEEDKNRFNNLIFLVECSNENEPTKKGFINFINRLKFIRPQRQWKPSDEQVKQLGWIAKQNKDNMIGKELVTLYNDLKKLKG